MKQALRVVIVAAMAMLTVSLAGCKKEKNDVDQQEEGVQTITAAGVKFKVVEVEHGSFVMGAIDGDTNAFDWEKPAHIVYLHDLFYIGQTEVTQELYQAVMDTNPSVFTGNDKLPVENVSFNDALAFCERLSALTGHTFTLPTEAQWEYAARGGNKAPSTPTLYAGGNNVGAVAWYLLNSSDKTHVVASKAPNELGIYDMSGNVWEWCLDFYEIYSPELQEDPVVTSGMYHVFRGGSWYNLEQFCRSSYRYYNHQNYKNNYLGFRIVMLP